MRRSSGSGGRDARPSRSPAAICRPRSAAGQISDRPSFERDQSRLRGLVIGLGEAGEVEFAADDLFSEVTGVTHLLPAEAAGAQSSVVEREERIRHERSAQPAQPAVHCRRGIDRHLLLENDVQQGPEAVSAAAKARRSRLLQDRGEDRLGRKHGDSVSQAFRRIQRRIFGRRSSHGAVRIPIRAQKPSGTCLGTAGPAPRPVR
jgi:hypothetical protein